LIVASAEFHSTSSNRFASQQRPVTQPTPSQGREYKALVVLFMNGGADTYNVLVPKSGCATKDLHAEYVAVRSAEYAIPQGDLLGIPVPASSQQPCDTFGLHPTMPHMQAAYSSCEALFVANIGAMVEPIDKQQFNDKSRRTPSGLFAHNVMQRHASTMHPQLASATGVLGRMAVALNSQPAQYRVGAYSINGGQKLLEGASPPADIVSSSEGIQRLGSFEQLGEAMAAMAGQNVSLSAMAETFMGDMKATLNKTEMLGGVLEGATLVHDTFGTSNIGKQFEQVAKLIKVRQELGSERDVFVVELGAFDGHNDLGPQLAEKLGQIDAAIKALKDNMVAEGIWDKVTVASLSEFGRTLTTNGRGTDHAWGGHHFIVGGGVKGKQILGKYPSTLTEDGPENIGRGRIIPTTPWEAIWKGLARWMGVQESKLAELLPNMANFDATDLFDEADLFDSLQC